MIIDHLIMKLAIFSDVHGNLTALKAVVSDIKSQSPDLILFGGDCCLLGARPAECLDLVREIAHISVYGNTDEWLHTPPSLPEKMSKSEKAAWDVFNERVAWTVDILGSERLSWLANLPFAHQISPTPDAASNLLLVHANPVDVLQPIFPTEEVQQKIVGQANDIQPDEALDSLLTNVQAGVIAYGHVHFPNIRRWRNLILANISSINLPTDGDPRAKYGLLTFDKLSGWTIDHRYVDYDLAGEIEVVRQLQPPAWEGLVERMQV